MEKSIAEHHPWTGSRGTPQVLQLPQFKEERRSSSRGNRCGILGDLQQT
jgi:hypothetical protein